MWDDFTDFELAELAGTYGIEEELVFAYDLSLANRGEIESRLTEIEYDLAFAKISLDFNSDLVYNCLTEEGTLQ
jgi:hypothetical protein